MHNLGALALRERERVSLVIQIWLFENRIGNCVSCRFATCALQEGAAASRARRRMAMVRMVA